MTLSEATSIVDAFDEAARAERERIIAVGGYDPLNPEHEKAIRKALAPFVRRYRHNRLDLQEAEGLIKSEVLRVKGSLDAQRRTLWPAAYPETKAQRELREFAERQR